MADYYVMYQGTKYEVENFSAGIAKAKELGSDAVFYCAAPVTEASYADGVKTVFSGGNEGSAYPYAGGLNNALDTAEVTFTGGSWSYVFNGARGEGTVKNSTLTVEDGAIQNLFAGGWADDYKASVGQFATLNVTGGTFYAITASPYAGVLDEACVNISGGSIYSYSATRKSGSVKKVTTNISGGTFLSIQGGCGHDALGTVEEHYLNITGGTITGLIGGNTTGRKDTPGTLGKSVISISGGTIINAIYLGNSTAGAGDSGSVEFTVSGNAMIGNSIICGNNGSTSALGDVTLNLLGGTLLKHVYGTGDVTGYTQGKVTINIDGYYGYKSASQQGAWVYAGYKSNAESITVNMKSGCLHFICLGASNDNFAAPVTLNMTGGTANWLIGGSYAQKASTGDLTVNVSGGLVSSYFFMGCNKTVPDFVERIGDITVNLSGGTIKPRLAAGGRNIQEGNIFLNISDNFVQSNQIYAGGDAAGSTITGNTNVNITGGSFTSTIYAAGVNGTVKGDANITVSGGTWSGASYWLCGSGAAGSTVEGTSRINIVDGANVYHVFGGNVAGAVVKNGVEINVSGGDIYGVIHGGGYRSEVQGAININVTGGTFHRDKKDLYFAAGQIVGGISQTAAIHDGDINVSVTGGVNLTAIFGGNVLGSTVGNVNLKVADVTLGYTDGETIEYGTVYTACGSNCEAIGTFTATISNVTSNGSLLIGSGANYIEGDATVTVSDSTFVYIAIEAGYKVEEENEETGEVTVVETKETEINGNVLFDLTDVTVSGNVYGQSLEYELVRFAEGFGATLAVNGKLTAGGEVAYFDNITIAAGATIEAGSVTASAITATASAEDGAYLLATGFAAQDSVITVVNASGSTIGTVTLSEAVTSGSFNVGSDTYGVEVTTDGLYLLKNAEAPEPATDYFVVVNGGTTFFGAIEDAQAFALENAGSVLYVNTTEDVCQYLNGIETHFIADIATAKYRNGGVDGRVNAAQPASTKMVFDAGLYDSIFAGSYNGGTSTNPDYTAKSFEVVFNAGTTANLYASGRTIAAGFVGAEKSTITVNDGKIGVLAACYTNAGLGAVEINVNGGAITTLESTLGTKADITGGITYNITGGNISNFFYAGSLNGGASTTTIQGGVVVNISGGKFSGRVSSATNNQKSNVTITGGMVLNLTGGSFAKDVYGTGDAVGTLAGGITIIIDGLESKNKVYGAYRVATESVNITMKSGSMTSLSGGAGEINMTVDTVINLEGGSVDFIFGTSGKFFESVGTTQVNVSNGVVNTLLSLNGGTAAGATLIGDATLNLTGGTVLGTITVNGGSAVKEAYTGALVGNANVNISGGTVSDIVVVTYGEVEGNVAVNLAGGVYTGKISGSNAAVSGTSVLNIAGAISTTGAVSEFDTITIDLAKSGSLTAASITAEAITVYGATESCTLATGFGVQTTSVTLDGIGTIALSAEAVSGSITAGDKVYTVSMQDNALLLNVAGGSVPPVVENTTTAEIILTISDANHPSFGATGGWKVQTDQTVVWQDLSTLSGDFQILGQGYTVAGKAMTDIYIYSASAKYVGAYTTDDTGAITGFESIFTGENALMQVGLGDFTADGVSDLMLRTADGYLGFYANGAFTAVQGLGTEWSVEALGDVNGDGTTDIVIAHANGGYVGAYLIGKDGGITWGDLGSTEGGIEIVGAGDFNADGTDDVLVKSGSYYGAWLCGNGAVTGFFGIGTFEAEVQDIADYNADGTDDVLFRTADGIVGAALITGADASTWAQYGALGAEWSTKGVGIL